MCMLQSAGNKIKNVEMSSDIEPVTTVVRHVDLLGSLLK